MTTMTAVGRVPEFTLGWRLRLALETGGVSVQEMAGRLGYSRSTVSRWINDQDPPRAAVMAQWALITGVDPTWLANGIGQQAPPEPPAGAPDPGLPLDALAKLTEQKRSRARRGAGTTRQYAAPIPAFASAA